MAECLEDDREAELRYSFSRCSSAGSVHALTSSANNTDESDSDHGNQLTLKDRRREAHTQAEQKRRDAIKRGYDALQELLPATQNLEQDPGFKLSKAVILAKSIDYIQFLQDQKKKHEEEVAKFEKEMCAMSIMKRNYEQVLSDHQSQPGQMARQVSDEVKFEVFRAVMDSLFQTFDPCVSTDSFEVISGSIISWVEEHCQPQILREIMHGVLQQLRQHEYGSPATEPHRHRYSL